MRILFITTYYPPINSIASIRPWALCHYMAQLGNEITVLCAGKSNKVSQNEFYGESKGVRVIRCHPKNTTNNSTRKSTQKGNIIRFLKKAYYELDLFLQRHGNFHLYFLTLWIYAFYYYRKEKKELEKLKFKGEEFDVVISTFGGIENFFSGKYASKLFRCPLVQDFRDIISSGYCNGGIIRGYINKKTEKWAVENADAITGVSHDMLERLMEVAQLDFPYKVIYNGYVPVERKKVIASAERKLVFCYTGTIYEKEYFFGLFHALKNMINDNRILKKNIVIHYAGNSWDRLLKQLDKYNLKDIALNHGSISFDEAYALQNSSDIFLVARRNTNDDVGVISGKFYEGIRAQMPIVCLISGERPNSELYRINEKYHYGFCYEEASKQTHEPKLEKYLLEQYNRKLRGESLKYDPCPELFTDFRYDNLARNMDEVCKQAIKKYSNTL